MRALALSSFLILSSGLGACGGDNGPAGEDLCAASATPTAILGQGVGSAFVEYEDNEQVSLAVAPQGGFGVTVLIRTTGLEAGDNLTANVQLNVESGGQLAGEFLQENTSFTCRGGDIGGEIRGVVVGFDPDVYKTNDDLLALNGETVELVVTISDSNGNEATVRKPVVVAVGG